MIGKGDKIQDKVSYLKNFSLFTNLNEDELKEISKLLDTQNFTDGQTLFLQGDKGDRVYFLYNGLVKAVKSNLKGEEQILEILRPGDIFGEVVLFNIDSYPATATAMGDVEVLALPRDKFKSYFLDNPWIGWEMMKVMAEKLSKSQQKIKNLGLRDTRGRLAVLLIDLLYEQENLKDRAVLELNRQDMADFIGTTRETVSRALSEFKNKGLINTDGSSIYIKDLDRLREWTK